MYPISNNAPPSDIYISNTFEERANYWDREYELDMKKQIYPSNEIKVIMLCDDTPCDISKEIAITDIDLCDQNNREAIIETAREWGDEYDNLYNEADNTTDADVMLRAGITICQCIQSDLKQSDTTQEILFLAEYKNKPVAILHAGIGKTSELLSIVINPKYISHEENEKTIKGLGSIITDKFISFLRERTQCENVMVHTISQQSANLLEKFGFIENKIQTR